MQGDTYVFFGMVGSGKGTQIKLLIDFLKERDGKETVYAYPGHEYRKLVSSGSYTGSLVKDSIARGELQPNFLTISIFVNVLITSLTYEKHFIADGYPRTLFQAESFDEMMDFYKRNNVKVIYIEVSKEEATKRNMLRGRGDDTEKGLAKRFDEYVEKVVPAMDYLKNLPRYELLTINGEQSVEDVHKDIIKALNF